MRDFAPDADERFSVSPDAHLLRLKDRAALFCERRQQLSAFNDTALLIWEALASGQAVDQAAKRLEALGLSAPEARAFVEGAADGWTRDGHLGRASALARLRERPVGLRHLEVDGFPFVVRFHGEVASWQIEAAFGHLARDPDVAGAEIDVVEHDGRHALFVGGAPRGETDAEGVVPALKALITELYAASVAEGFLVHGALLRAPNGKTLFLTGEPGAGKTTLTLALTAAGFIYGGDDIVRITPQGLATAAPFAAAVKAGAWDLLSDRVPELPAAPVHRRADRQAVRYLAPVGPRALAPAPLDFVLILRRDAGAAPGFEPVHPLDALVTLLDCAYSRKGAADGPTLIALAERLQHAACFAFAYSDLDRAVAAVRDRL